MFSKDVYQSRRAHLSQRLRSGLVLVPGHSVSPINFAANSYPFRQDSTFLYFGGPAVPDLVMLIDCDMNQSILCGRDAKPEETLWSGASPTLAQWAESAAFDKVETLETLSDRLNAAGRQHRAIHYLPPYRADQILTFSRLMDVPPDQVTAQVSCDLIRAVVDQRSVKTADEVAEIEMALGICRAMYKAATAARLENQTPMEIFGRMASVVASRGSHFAFAPIVTPRGDILHGGIGPEPLKEEDLLIVDVGAESPRGYASDITRTLPVRRRFDTRQRELYEIVLKAQKTAIAAIAPGTRFGDVHMMAAKAICQGLIEIGLMRGPADDAVGEGAHALFFPHGLGHMLGLDAHDMEALGEDFVGYDDEVRRREQFGLAALRLGRRLEPGFVVTVEPGIYFNRGLIEQWRRERRGEAFINFEKVTSFSGFGGIRIEDDILVTEDAGRVLGPTIPKSVATVESSLQ